MPEPKIIFRDFSIQHASCFMPVYEMMKKQGFNCELQVIDVPISSAIDEFIKKHMNDEFDAMVTAEVMRLINVPSDYPVDDALKMSRKQREKTFYVFHGIGGSETPVYDFYEFKGVFFTGPYWMAHFKSMNLVAIQYKCKYCDYVGADYWRNISDYQKWLLKPNWYCNTHKNVFLGTSVYDHIDFQKETYNLNNMHMIGYPKLDILKLPEGEKMAIDLRNKLDMPYNKTLLYAPTMKRLDNLDETGISLLDIVKDVDINLLIKTHCDDEEEKYQPKNYKIFKEKALSMKNVRWIGGTFPSIAPLYLISDILVSGASSCLREFMVTDRPSIQVTNWSEEVTKDIPSYAYKGSIQSSLSDLKDNINRAIDNPKWMHEERQEEVRLHIYKPDGHATDRTVNKIKELMGW